MEAHAANSSTAAPRARQFRLPGVGAGLGRGVVVLYLSLMVLLPLAALTDESFSEGIGQFRGERILSAICPSLIYDQY